MLSANSISMDIFDVYSGRSLVELTCSAKISNKFTLRFRIQSISGCKPAEKVSSTYFNLKLAIKMLSEMIDKNIGQQEWPKFILFLQKHFEIFKSLLIKCFHVIVSIHLFVLRNSISWQFWMVANFLPKCIGLQLNVYWHSLNGEIR